MKTEEELRNCITILRGMAGKPLIPRNAKKRMTLAANVLEFAVNDNMDMEQGLKMFALENEL